MVIFDGELMIFSRMGFVGKLSTGHPWSSCENLDCFRLHKMFPNKPIHWMLEFSRIVEELLHLESLDMALGSLGPLVRLSRRILHDFASCAIAWTIYLYNGLWFVTHFDSIRNLPEKWLCLSRFENFKRWTLAHGKCQFHVFGPRMTLDDLRHNWDNEFLPGGSRSK